MIFKCTKHAFTFIKRKCFNSISIKSNIKNQLFPKRDTCTLMIVSNLAEPYWISVNCGEYLLHTVVCSVHPDRKQISNNYNWDILKYKKICYKNHIQISSFCYLFVWQNISRYWDMSTNQEKYIAIAKKDIFKFYHLFNAISSLPQLPTDHYKKS